MQRLICASMLLVLASGCASARRFHNEVTSGMPREHVESRFDPDESFKNGDHTVTEYRVLKNPGACLAISVLTAGLFLPVCPFLKTSCFAEYDSSDTVVSRSCPAIDSGEIDRQSAAASAAAQSFGNSMSGARSVSCTSTSYGNMTRTNCQ